MKLVTLDEIKQYLKISGASFDALLDQINDKASSFISNQVNRTFELTTYEEVYSGEDITDELMLDNYPITQIEVFSLDIDLVNKTINDSLNVNTLLLNKELGLLRYIENNFPAGRNNIYIKYKAGYSEIPDYIKHIVLNLVSKKYYEVDQKRFGKQSKTVGGETVSFQLEELTATDKKALANVRYIPRKEGFNITIP